MPKIHVAVKAASVYDWFGPTVLASSLLRSIPARPCRIARKSDEVTNFPMASRSGFASIDWCLEYHLLPHIFQYLIVLSTFPLSLTFTP